MLSFSSLSLFFRSTAPRQEQGITMVLKHTVLVSQIGAHWEKMLPGCSLPQWDTMDMEGEEEVSAS